jgi:hypothetical protein
MNNKLLALLPVMGFVFMMFAISGCAPTPHAAVIRPPLTIPPQMFQCEDAGPRPKGKVVMESEVSRYIANLEYANKDCKTQLKELSVLVKCYNDPKCNVDNLIEYIGLVAEPKKH